MKSNDISEIEKLMATYFEGIFYGNPEKLETVFHKNSSLYGDLGEVLYVKRRDEFIADVKQRKSPNELGEPFKMKTLEIDLIGQIALAKVHVPMLGYNYYDYLSLTKIDGQWIIVNKLFKHVEP